MNGKNKFLEVPT